MLEDDKKNLELRMRSAVKGKSFRLKVFPAKKNQMSEETDKLKARIARMEATSQGLFRVLQLIAHALILQKSLSKEFLHYMLSAAAANFEDNMNKAKSVEEEKLNYSVWTHQMEIMQLGLTQPPEISPEMQLELDKFLQAN